MDKIELTNITLEEGPTANIQTLEGVMHADVAGEIYPCKPDIFMKTYEKVIHGGSYEIPPLMYSNHDCDLKEPVRVFYHGDLDGDTVCKEEIKAFADWCDSQREKEKLNDKCSIDGA